MINNRPKLKEIQERMASWLEGAGSLFNAFRGRASQLQRHKGQVALIGHPGFAPITMFAICAVVGYLMSHQLIILIPLGFACGVVYLLNRLSGTDGD